LPKGWPDGRETGPEAAAREAMEESGVVGRIDPQEPLGCYYYLKRFQFGRSVLCRVTVFGLCVEDFKADFRDKGRRVLRWCSPEYGAGLVHEPDLADLLMRFSVATPADGRPARVPSL
jgi:8-oxo-dGTP pyrophosphatase MutT (NUDIX family)